MSEGSEGNRTGFIRLVDGQAPRGCLYPAVIVFTIGACCYWQFGGSIYFFLIVMAIDVAAMVGRSYIQNHRTEVRSYDVIRPFPSWLLSLLAVVLGIVSLGATLLLSILVSVGLIGLTTLFY